MVIGGDHTVWVMRGDPADGGRIDNISSTIGIIGPDAFAFDPSSVLYFFGDGVLWKMTPDGQITPLSRGRMDRTFGAIDFSTNTMRLLWDETAHGLHIFVTPTVAGSSRHYWWDARTDSFFPDSYPVVQGPTAVMVFDSNVPNDRAILLGGQDGYVRKEDLTTKTDDGTTIHSYVKFAPITPGGLQQNARLSRMTTILDSTSDPVTCKIYAAQSPQEVVADTTIAWAKEMSPQIRYAIPRVTGNSMLFELENNSFSATWTTGTAYAIGDQVVASDGNPYVSLTAHTSTTGGSHPTPPGNTTDWVLSSFRTWALESLSAVSELTGRTRHGRL
jgi:hypothetical protein